MLPGDQGHTLAVSNPCQVVSQPQGWLDVLQRSTCKPPHLTGQAGGAGHSRKVQSAAWCLTGVSPFLKVYRRQRTIGRLASGGSVCSSTTPFTVLLSSASFPDSAKLASGGGLSSFGKASSLLWWFQSRSAKQPPEPRPPLSAVKDQCDQELAGFPPLSWTTLFANATVADELKHTLPAGWRSGRPGQRLTVLGLPAVRPTAMDLALDRCSTPVGRGPLCMAHLLFPIFRRPLSKAGPAIPAAPDMPASVCHGCDHQTILMSLPGRPRQSLLTARALPPSCEFLSLEDRFAGC